MKLALAIAIIGSIGLSYGCASKAKQEQSAEVTQAASELNDQTATTEPEQDSVHKADQDIKPLTPKTTKKKGKKKRASSRR